MTGPSWQARVLSPILKNTLRPVIFPRIATTRSMALTAFALRQVERLRPALLRSRVEPVVTQGFKGEWVDTGHDSGRVLLYFHGGGYMVMSPRGYRDFSATLATVGRCRVLAVDYRQGAYHPWPAPLADALASYRWLLAQGYRPDQIVIGGDSAGGHLTLSTLLALRDQGLPLPRGGIAISPWTNLGCDFLSHDANRDSDVILDIRAIRSNAVYQLQGRNPRDADVSPAFADYTGLPPLHIIASTSEILLDDARAARDAALRAGVPVDYREWEGLPHVFPILGPLLPEAREAVADMAAFLDRLYA